LVEQLLTTPDYVKDTFASLLSFLGKFDEAFILFIMAARCLPLYCRNLFEADKQSEYPTISQLLDFGESRVQVLEN